MVNVGIDVGGTFTDLVVFDGESGRISAAKVPSTPEKPAEAIITGLVALVPDGASITHLIHGTTVATNAILERKGARVGLVTTRGFRDLIEIGRTQRLVEGGMFNPRFVRPQPLVRRSLRFEVGERLLSDGSVLHPLNEDDVEAISAQLRDAGIQSIAVCFLHSYRNAAHEARARQLLHKALPEASITLSCEVVPEHREFERFSTAVLNAYVSPIVSRYLEALDRALRAHEYTAPMFTMSSNGGILTSRRAGDFAVLTVLSGPVGGVNGSIAVGRTVGIGNLITCDMGGTSTDVCLVRDSTPAVSNECILAGFPVRVPQVDINTVGAGGGSIAWVDRGELRVGPRSAGADPGPACYRRGGIEPTVTDANLVLGRMHPERTLGGAILLDDGLAREAVGTLAKHLGGLDLDRTADGIIRLAVARMTSSIREISVQRGYDPREFVLIAFGGAGPMHATQIAEELGSTSIIIPRYPGNLSALGLLTSDLKEDYVRSYLAPFNIVSPANLEALFAELQQIGRERLRLEGVAESDLYFSRSLDLRYVGQAFELSISLPAVDYTLESIRRDFRLRYMGTYGHANDDAEIQIVNVRVSAFGRVAKPTLPPLACQGSVADARVRLRSVYFDGRLWDTPFYDRERLPSGARITGPAVVEETGATTVLAPGWNLEVDGWGHLLLRSK